MRLTDNVAGCAQKSEQKSEPLQPIDDDDVIYDVIATCRYRILRHSAVTLPQKQL